MRAGESPMGEGRIVASRCRRCRTELDAATGVDADGGPTPGAVSICWCCGTVSFFADDLTLTEPTIEEVDELLDDAQVAAILSRLWDARLAHVVERVGGVEFACGCRTSAGGGLFTLEACAENCAAARTVMRMADGDGMPIAVIR